MISYTLERCDRKSIAIYVRNGAVCVKAPMRAAVSTIENFIRQKTPWIIRKREESLRRYAAYADVLEGKAFLYLGERLLVSVTKRKTPHLKEGEICIPEAFIDGDTLCYTDSFRRLLRIMYRKAAKSYLENRIKEISCRLGMAYASMGLTNAESKWGSCDTLNRIRLNWHLVLLSPDLIDYVIVHELAHTVEHNHSHAFWEIVAAGYSGYKEAKACLKTMNPLIDLYN